MFLIAHRSLLIARLLLTSRVKWRIARGGGPAAMRDTRSPRVPAHPHDPDAAEAAELARALAQVETLYRTGRVPEALAACRPLATRYPRESGVLGMLGLLYAREGNIHQALERLTAALAVSPAHPV